MTKQPMICPECGAVMNHHADKLTYVEGGEYIEEFHACPACGASACRESVQQF
jgi:ribosomal protein S27AE